MPTSNLDLVRSIFAAWARGDFSSVEWAHREIEYIFLDGPHPGSWTGLAGMAKANRDFLTAWEDWRIQAEEYHALDDERVLVLTRMSGRGKRSGVELGHMHSKNANLFQIRNGQVTRLALYWDRSRALALLDLTPRHDAS